MHYDSTDSVIDTLKAETNGILADLNQNQDNLESEIRAVRRLGEIGRILKRFCPVNPRAQPDLDFVVANIERIKVGLFKSFDLVGDEK